MPTPKSAEKYIRWVPLLVLAAIFCALGWILIPAHWTSIWMDREFTGWVAPIANRLVGGSRLYANGLHSPMPPLPYVFLRVLFHGDACWIHESFFYFLFQAATLAALYLAFARRWGRLTAFIAVLAATPIFFSMAKTILYDSMAQFFVALSGIWMVEFAMKYSKPQSRAFFSGRGRLFAGGGTLGLLMLTKQSTGAGTAVAAALVLLLLPRQAPLRDRILNTCLCAITAILTFCIVGVALSPWVSFTGLLHDVFIVGSEPKGGPGVLVHKLLHQTVELLFECLVRGAAPMLLFLMLWRIWLFPGVGIRHLFQYVIGERTFAFSQRLTHQVAGVATASAFIGGTLMFFLVHKTQDIGAGHRLLYPALSLGLFCCVCSLLLLFAGRDQNDESRIQGDAAGGYALIFLISAMFHSLSVGFFRWQVDNNPLVVLALVFVVRLLLLTAETMFSGGRKSGNRLAVGLTAILMLVAWRAMGIQMLFAGRCTQSWTEIHYLQSAGLRPECEGMRTLAKTVRNLCSRPEDEVLLLPGDPNVEAWFDRPRPQLSCAIIFVDQYWDHYAKTDLAELEKHPPKVIVLGPRDYWRGFDAQWKTNWGADRLIDQVQTRLLPQRYSLFQAQPISFGKGKEFMDVYIRKEL